MRINKRTAFSLIELMVVIAIVALLAAVAVPSYKEYIGRANLTNAVSAMDYLTAQSSLYYSTKGTFPEAVDLGIQDPINNSSIAPGVLARFNMQTNWFDPITNLMSGGCTANIGFIIYQPGLTQMGFSETYDVATFTCYLWDNNDTVKKFCWYQVYNNLGGNPDPDNELKDDVLAGWSNLCTTCTEGQANYTAAVTEMPSVCP